MLISNCDVEVPTLPVNALTSLACRVKGMGIDHNVVASLDTPNSNYAITSAFVLDPNKIAPNVKNISGNNQKAAVLSVSLVAFSDH